MINIAFTNNPVLYLLLTINITFTPKIWTDKILIDIDNFDINIHFAWNMSVGHWF